MSQAIVRMLILPSGFPPDGALDFAGAGLVSRQLELVSSLVVVPHDLAPDNAYDREGRPRAEIFSRIGATHVLVISGRAGGAEDLQLHGDLHDASGRKAPLDARGRLGDAAAVALALALQICAHLKVQPSADELKRMRTPALPPGPAFGHLVAYWRGVYGESIDWMAELEAAGEAGAASAWLKLAAWDSLPPEEGGRFDDAERTAAYFDAAVEADPFLLLAHERRAWILRRTGRAEEALATADAALAMAPLAPGLWAQRAHALRALGEEGAATQAARTAYELAPSSDSAVDVLAAQLRADGHLDEAIRILGEAAAASPDDLRVKASYADALNAARRFPEAHAALADALERAGRLPWWRLPWKMFHLDRTQTARFFLAEPAALAAAGAGADPTPYARLYFELHPEPQSLGPIDAWLTSIKTRALYDTGTGRGPQHGGVTTIERFAELQVEIERATASGVALPAVLEHFGLDPQRWMKAQSHWGERMEDGNVVSRWVAAKQAYAERMGPMPRFAAAAATTVAAYQPPQTDPNDNGGVATVGDWARILGTVQKTLAQGRDFTAALAAVGLDMARYQAASSFWNARTAADPDLGMKLFEAMNQYL